MALLGLRGKSLLALLLACLIALVPAALIGWQVVDSIRTHLGEAYVRNVTLLQRERIFAPVSRELALSLRLADSVLTRQWLLDEDNAERRRQFFAEAEGYRRDFRDHSYFLVSNQSFSYYFNDRKNALSEQPRYFLQHGKAEDGWYFATMRNTSDFNINVDYDHALKTTKVWINVLVHDGASKIGLAGTGLDLSSFLDDFIRQRDTGVTPMILNRHGAIQAHPDSRLIALNSAAQHQPQQQTGLQRLLDDAGARGLQQAMRSAEAKPGQVSVFWGQLDGKRQLFALSFIPALGWHVVTAVDLNAARVFEGPWLTPALIALAVLLVALLLGFAWAVEKLVLRPISQLRHSAQAMAAGQYEVALPAERDDEIGELSAAFGVMAHKVRSHTTELEQRVRERTRELEEANREMAAAHKKIDDSIDYASLIQRAMLPDRQLVQALGEKHAVLWHPRDVVGGDFYVYRAGEHSCLFGVVDCAGHGVPGALMTMLAHAAIDQAISDIGMQDPAAILARCDRILRGMRRDEDGGQMLATNMDVGLAFVDLRERQVTFAGAKIALYYSDGDNVAELAGARRAIGDKRVGDYRNASVPLQVGRSFYMTTDGFLDQAGGELGFGFGSSRFTDMIRRHAGLPLAAQGEAYRATLADYQGSHAQRDDITMLCFRFD
ncbi:biofilm regulation protein phosphatase SiaA [Vogesella facilis]|uniref:Biofilm regulation protein phosphatase SiaA n=1 Tax=Vogesella facilis TaxID=1655232 RepID=A0ABV7RCP2_9NEIS